MNVNIQREVTRGRNIEDEDGVTGQRVSKERDKNQEPVTSNAKAIGEKEDVGEVSDGNQCGGSHGGNGSKTEEKRGKERIKKGKEQVNRKFFLKNSLYIADASYFSSTLKLPVKSLTQQSKFHNFDPNDEINQLILVFEFYPKHKIFEINNDKLAEKIIKVSYVKSKDQLADILFKAIGSKALKNFLASSVSVILRSNLKGSVGK